MNMKNTNCWKLLIFIAFAMCLGYLSAFWNFDNPQDKTSTLCNYLKNSKSILDQHENALDEIIDAPFFCQQTYRSNLKTQHLRNFYDTNFYIFFRQHSDISFVKIWKPIFNPFPIYLQINQLLI
jgi:hypothetical protein